MAQITRRDFLKFGFTSAAVAGLGGSLAGCFSPPPEVPQKMARTAGSPSMHRQYLPPLPGRMRHYWRSLRWPTGQNRREPQTPQQPGKDLFPRACGDQHSLRPRPPALSVKTFRRAGTGEWARISWDQAWEEIAKRLTTLKKRGRRKDSGWRWRLPVRRSFWPLNF